MIHEGAPVVPTQPTQEADPVDDNVPGYHFLFPLHPCSLAHRDVQGVACLAAAWNKGWRCCAVRRTLEPDELREVILHEIQARHLILFESIEESFVIKLIA